MHPMKRVFMIALLSVGAVGGFAHGFASLAFCAARHHESRRAYFEDHVADVCTRSAERVFDERGADPRGYESRGHEHRPDGLGRPQHGPY